MTRASSSRTVGRQASDLGWRRPRELPATVESFRTADHDGVGDTDVVLGRGYRRRLTELGLRLLDVVVAAAALVVLSPLVVAIAVAVKLDSPGPILYRQLRIGRDRRERGPERRGGRRTGDLGGEPFMMYKFRTMRCDAEDGSGPVWARAEDDRVTRVGAFLRRHRLDEIPQFVNVLKGEMSVVGPRPERPSFVGRLREEIGGYRHRQRVRPGITGWAQVHQDADRCVDDVRRKLLYDLEYVRRRSVTFNLGIMARTPIVMLKRDGIETGGTAQ